MVLISRVQEDEEWLLAVRLADIVPQLSPPQIPCAVVVAPSAGAAPEARDPAVIHWQPPTAPSWWHAPQPPLVIVTAVSASFFDRVRNLVGSVHVHEPAARLVLYDLGMTEAQRSEALVRSTR